MYSEQKSPVRENCSLHFVPAGHEDKLSSSSSHSQRAENPCQKICLVRTKKKTRPGIIFLPAGLADDPRRSLKFPGRKEKAVWELLTLCALSYTCFLSSFFLFCLLLCTYVRTDMSGFTWLKASLTVASSIPLKAKKLGGLRVTHIFCTYR